MKKAIIVDDEKKVCKLIRYLIDWQEYDIEIVGEAYDGKSAYDLICRDHPELVLTDIRIPEMDGLELIERCKEIYPDIYFIVISGYSNFEYAHKAIKFGVEDYLLKPLNRKNFSSAIVKVINKIDKVAAEKTEKQQLNLELQRYTIMLQKSRLEMFNKNYSSDTNYNFALFHQLFADHAQVCQAIIRPIISDENKSIESLLLSKAEDVAKEFLRAEGYESVCTAVSPYVVCLISGKNSNQETLNHCFRKIRKEILGWRSVWNITEIHIGISNYKGEISQLPACMLESHISVLQGMVGGKSYLNLYSPEMADTEAINSIFDANEQQQLKKGITFCDETRIRAVLRNLQEGVMVQKLSGYAVRQIYFRIIDSFCYGIEGASLEIDANQLRQSLEQIWNRSGTVTELFEGMIQSVSKYFQDWNNMRELKKTRPIRLAQQYILDNYADAVSLEDVSKAVGLSPSYFSSLFKKETGQTITDFLIEVRIQNAKELLIKTDMSISIVMERVGYNDIKHFAKLFKKISGISPTEYRRIYG